MFSQHAEHEMRNEQYRIIKLGKHKPVDPQLPQTEIPENRKKDTKIHKIRPET